MKLKMQEAHPIANQTCIKNSTAKHITVKLLHTMAMRKILKAVKEKNTIKNNYQTSLEQQKLEGSGVKSLVFRKNNIESNT